ncbi:hypothetical protein ABPG77_005220 [Micractinium sp. CCAP 211/92]
MPVAARADTQRAAKHLAPSPLLAHLTLLVAAGPAAARTHAASRLQTRLLSPALLLHALQAAATFFVGCCAFIVLGFTSFQLTLLLSGGLPLAAPLPAGCGQGSYLPLERERPQWCRLPRRCCQAGAVVRAGLTQGAPSLPCLPGPRSAPAQGSELGSCGELMAGTQAATCYLFRPPHAARAAGLTTVELHRKREVQHELEEAAAVRAEEEEAARVMARVDAALAGRRDGPASAAAGHCAAADGADGGGRRQRGAEERLTPPFDRGAWRNVSEVLFPHRHLQQAAAAAAGGGVAGKKWA